MEENVGTQETQCNFYVKEISEKKVQTIRWTGKVKSIQTKPDVRNKSVLTDLSSDCGPRLDMTLLKRKHNNGEDNDQGKVDTPIKLEHQGNDDPNIKLEHQDKDDPPIKLELVSAEETYCYPNLAEPDSDICCDRGKIKIESKEDVFEELEKIIRGKESLTVSYVSNDAKGTCFLEVSRTGGARDIGGAEEYPIRVKFYSDGIVFICKVFKKPIEDNFLDHNNKLDELVIENVLSILNSRYEFCCGIKNKYSITKCASLEKYSFPFERSQSKQCPIMFKPSSIAKQPYQCPKCGNLERYIRHREKVVHVTPITELRRQDPSSNFPFSELTPKSRAIRLKSLRNLRYRQKKQIKKLEQELRDTSMALNRNKINNCEPW